MVKVGGAYKDKLDLPRAENSSELTNDVRMSFVETDSTEKTATFSQVKEQITVTGNVNPTSGRIPLNTAGAFVDSALEEQADVIVSSKSIQTPGGSLFVGRSTRVFDAGGLIGGQSLLSGNEGLAIVRRYTRGSGTEAQAFTLNIGAAVWDIQQSVDSETLTIAPSGSMSFTFTSGDNFFVYGARLRGTQGQIRCHVDVQGASEQIRLLNGDQDLPSAFDFDGVGGTGEVEKFFTHPLIFSNTQAITITCYNVGSGDAILKGVTVGQDFAGYISINRGVYTEDNWYPVDDTATDANHTLSASEIDDRITNATSILPFPRFTAFSVDINDVLNPGDTISGTHTFTWTIENSQNISGNLTISETLPSQSKSTISSSVDPALGTIDLAVTSVTLQANEQVTYTIEGVDTQMNAFSATDVKRVPEQHEFLYEGRQSINNFEALSLDQLTKVEITGSGQQITVSRGTGSAGDFYGILVPANEDLSTIHDDVLNQDVTAIFTKSTNARQINGINYNIYVLGPLAATTDANYVVTIA